MTEDELTAIEARAKAAKYSSAVRPHVAAAADVPALVAEVRRLQTDLSVHRSAVSELQNDVDDLMLRDKPETTLYRFHEWKRRAEAAEADVERLEVLCEDLGNTGAAHAKCAEAAEAECARLRPCEPAIEGDHCLTHGDACDGPTDELDLGLLRKMLEGGPGGRRTGALQRAGFIRVEVTEAGLAALAAKEG